MLHTFLYIQQRHLYILLLEFNLYVHVQMYSLCKMDYWLAALKLLLSISFLCKTRDDYRHEIPMRREPT